MITCIRCGHQNKEGAKFCQSCNAVLPRISSSVASPPPERINIHYNQLKEAGEKVQNGSISFEEFLNILNRIYKVISDRLADIESMEISDEIRPSLEEQLQIGISGIHFFLQGIDEMRLYTTDTNSEHISAGMALVFQGNENLNQALEMARENLRRLKEMGFEESELTAPDN
jgi:translation initiation factor 2B subunit (eIF-2B alpha/beta/delta family)